MIRNTARSLASLALAVVWGVVETVALGLARRRAARLR